MPVLQHISHMGMRDVGFAASDLCLQPCTPFSSQVLGVLTACSEYDELPVRHNEDVINTQLARQVGPGLCSHTHADAVAAVVGANVLGCMQQQQRTMHACTS
jgi:hypothetical protein